MEGVGRGLRGRKWEGPVGLKGIRMVAPERGDEKSSGRLTVVIQVCACARVCACVWLLTAGSVQHMLTCLQ